MARSCSIAEPQTACVTQEEAEAVTEISDAEEAAWSILDRPGAVTQWCVIKLGGEGALLCTKSPRRRYWQRGLQVGCCRRCPLQPAT